MAEHFEVLIGFTYPYFCTGQREERELAVQKLTGGLLASLIPGGTPLPCVRLVGGSACVGVWRGAGGWAACQFGWLGVGRRWCGLGWRG